MFLTIKLFAHANKTDYLQKKKKKKKKISR